MKYEVTKEATIHPVAKGLLIAAVVMASSSSLFGFKWTGEHQQTGLRTEAISLLDAERDVLRIFGTGRPDPCTKLGAEYEWYYGEGTIFSCQ